MTTERPSVVAVSRSRTHSFSKSPVSAIRVIEGLGVEDDAHAGSTVQHLSRVAADPAQPNLRQVHLIAAELFEELAEAGFQVKYGDMGENLVTRGMDLVALPRATVLRLGSDAAVRVTGLRNPCRQLNDFQPGLMQAVLGRDEDGAVQLRCGIMAVAIASGELRPGDAVVVERPSKPWVPLERV